MFQCSADPKILIIPINRNKVLSSLLYGTCLNCKTYGYNKRRCAHVYFYDNKLRSLSILLLLERTHLIEGRDLGPNLELLLTRTYYHFNWPFVRHNIVKNHVIF